MKIKFSVLNLWLYLSFAAQTAFAEMFTATGLSPFVGLRSHSRNLRGCFYSLQKSALLHLATLNIGRFRSALVFSAVLFTGSLMGQVSIIGNYSSTNDQSRTLIAILPGENNQKAVKFTMGGSAYPVHSLKLRLQYALTDVILDVSIRKDDAGGTKPGSLHSAFSNPTLSNAKDNYIFTPASPTILNANTAYWILVDNNSTVQKTDANAFRWLINIPSITPTSSGYATFNSYRFSTNNGTSYANSTTYNSFELFTCTTIVTPSVGIAANPSGSIARGTNVTFTATPTNGGTTPSYQWKKNGNNVGTNSVTYADATLANGDVISCMMTSNDACVSSTTATSTGTTMTVTNVIPVELVAFTAKADNAYNKLNWEVATQINVAHYTIERSGNGVDNWRNIGQVKAQKDSKTTLFYSFEDKTPLSLTYYRLKIVDVGGKLSYSKVVAVTQTARKMVQRIYPNPATDQLTVENMDSPTLNIINTAGQTVLKTNVNKNATLNIGDLPKGVYFIQNGDKTFRFVKM